MLLVFNHHSTHLVTGQAILTPNDDDFQGLDSHPNPHAIGVANQERCLTGLKDIVKLSPRPPQKCLCVQKPWWKPVLSVRRTSGTYRLDTYGQMPGFSIFSVNASKWATNQVLVQEFRTPLVTNYRREWYHGMDGSHLHGSIGTAAGFLLFVLPGSAVFGY